MSILRFNHRIKTPTRLLSTSVPKFGYRSPAPLRGTKDKRVPHWWNLKSSEHGSMIGPSYGYSYEGQGIKRSWVKAPAREVRSIDATGQIDHRNQQRTLYDRENAVLIAILKWFKRSQELGEKSRFKMVRERPDLRSLYILMFYISIGYALWRLLEYEYRDYAGIGTKHDFESDTDYANYLKTLKKELRYTDTAAYVYSILPWRVMSRAWGLFQHIDWKYDFIKTNLYKAYIKAAGVDLDEALVTDLTRYKNLNSFFRRRLKPGLRPIAETKIVSPSDGKILAFGKLTKQDNFMIEQVKGLNYSIKGFLGPNVNLQMPFPDVTNEEYVDTIKVNAENDIYYTCVYLAPKDYHRFHSPIDWKCTDRRHVPGDLYSVHPKIVNWLNNLYSLNERVILNGIWEHGFFSYTAVGASLVGQTKVYFDEGTVTNLPYADTKAHKHNGYVFDREYDQPIDLIKGEPIGEFNIGSTIILIFEAPKDFEFNLKIDQDVKMGQSLTF